MNERGEAVLDDGRRVHYSISGTGPPIVLCHGTPWSSWVWHRIVPLLAPTRRVYTWDMVGYGQSDKAEGDVSLAIQTDLLAKLLREWNLTEPAIVGHDFGGAVALRSHLLTKIGYRSMTLIDPVVLSPWGSPFFTLVRENAHVFAQLPPALHRALVAEYVSTTGGPALCLEEVNQLVEPWSSGPEAKSAFYRQIAQADQRYTEEVEAFLSTIRIPIQIVWGAEDAWLPVEQASRLHDAIPHSVLTVVAAAGHLLPLQQPRQLAKLLLNGPEDRSPREGSSMNPR